MKTLKKGLFGITTGVLIVVIIFCMFYIVGTILTGEFASLDEKEIRAGLAVMFVFGFLGFFAGIAVGSEEL